MFKYSSKRIMGQGYIIFDIAQNWPLTYTFDTKESSLNSIIKVDRFSRVNMENSNLVLTPLEKLEMKQESFDNSHFSLTPRLTVGYDLIYFSIFLIGLLLFFFIIRSQKKCLLSSFAKIKNAKWCLGTNISPGGNIEIRLNNSRSDKRAETTSIDIPSQN